MKKIFAFAAIFACIGVSGCGSLAQRLDPSIDDSVSAAPIDLATPELQAKLADVERFQKALEPKDIDPKDFDSKDGDEAKVAREIKLAQQAKRDQEVTRAKDIAAAKKARAIAAKARADLADAEMKSIAAAADASKTNTKAARARAAAAAKLAEQRQDSADSAQADADTAKALVDARRNSLKRAKLEYLAGVVFQSEKKCNAFMNRIVIGQNTVDTTGDILATTFSALSTAFSPAATKTALSAASSIASGTKANVDADIYAKAAISDFATAISQSYYANVQTYTTNLPNLTDTDDVPLVVTNEISKIESYHATCALASAESTIKASLAKAAATPPTPPPPPATTGSTPPTQPGAQGVNVPPAAVTLPATQPQVVSSTAAVPGAALAAPPPPPAPVPQ